jgi:multidrug efflux system membrane fusion protein
MSSGDTSLLSGEGPSPHASPGKSRLPLFLAVAGVAILVGAVLFFRSGGAKSDKEKGGKPDRAIPVVGLPAKLGDLAIYQNGLGTVTPLQTVTIKSRVDGELIKVDYHEGQLVHQGDLLAQIDPRPFQVQLLQAEGQLAKDEAGLKNARADLERYKVLIAEDSVPRQQLDTQAALVSQFEAALKGDQAQVEAAKLNLTYSRITAPINGIVGLRLVDPGNIVRASDPTGLLVITQQQPISVVFTLSSDVLPSVLKQTRTGRKLIVEAWDRDLKNKLAVGALLAIDNQIDQATGTVKIKALFANEGSNLYPNQFVNARLWVDTLEKTVLVSTAALQRSPQSTYVYVVKSDSTVELRTVETMMAEGDQTAVKSGLQPGEIVVVDGVDKLQPGSKVTLSGGGGAKKRA